ncbi:3-oxo-5-alpha-steroid 4-dehydrogenase-domain-containing protein [Radiomyces spectabilis]|uniref:3-oxo-5-alpha-steroid 4-dehydrogenase-domain-containing protein n=1 Tax=Radiomyces spectabilis TaxID=64574 RepID=UPI00222117BA|nr:3-oxo-5-alpha-steroid 4-dehydrogenase-domain-containing protein [Radiomyces spectabilis]KAI8381011.1 3-oxo-5-alpha-steroid 4-dehydrogenase-domain-containing protein [Radiomyces spectabilis]
MYLIVFVCFCLCTLSALCVLAKYVPDLRSSVLAHGKLQSVADRPTSSLSRVVASWTVPKSWFTHFYIVGLAFALICSAELTAATLRRKYGLLLTFLRHWDNPYWGDTLSLTESYLGTTLMTIHLARRVYESFYIEKLSPTARMHVSHYLVGIGFYGAMVFGTWLEGAVSFGVWPESSPALRSFHYIYALISVTLFIYASLHQYRCHAILASLRTKKTNTTYSIPRGDWFERIVTPHYFCDILIYASLCILYRFRNRVLLCGLIWTTLNLSVTASETQRWYCRTFGPLYTTTFPRKRWIIIPCVY